MASTVLPNGIIIPEKYSRDWYNDLYHNWQELDNLLGGGTPKDGTLTIQKNGDTVGTFSANQATDETIDITVPTKTSDLTNDSDFVQSSDLATVATSGSYNDLTDTPTIPTVNNATLTIQKNGTNVQTFTANQSTNATANITVPTKTSDLTNDSGFITEDTTKIPLAGSNQISGDLIPSTDGTVNLGGPSYQWNNAYIKSLTINGVACGDILTHNASEFVDVSSNQTIGGDKTFTRNAFFSSYRVKIKHSSQEIGVVPSTNQWNGINFIDKNNSSTFSIEQAFLSNGNAMIHFSMTPNIAGGSLLRIFESVYIASADEIVTKSRTLLPDVNNSRDLGTSTNKWKSLNGINPGALSLPSISSTGANAWIALDTTDWVKNTAVSHAQKYTPLADGWLNVRVDNATMLAIAVGGNYMHQMIRSETANSLALLMPVFKNTEVAIMVGGNENLAYNGATFYPCQGNV